MKVKIERFFKGSECLIGEVYLNDKFFCYSLENPWLDNKPFVSAIPSGKYLAKSYSSKKYPNVTEILDVENRSKILIHAGNTAKDTAGCILLGSNYSKEKERITNSRRTLKQFFEKAGYEFEIEIINKFNEVKKMALPILALAAPFAKVLGKALTKKAAEVVLQKVEEKTGIKITTKEEARTALEQMKPEDIKEIELAVINADKQKFMTEIKQGEKLDKTFKDDFVTYAIYMFLFSIVGILFFDGERGVMIIKNLKPLFESYFGLTFMLVSISAVGLRHVALKVADGFINKYR